MGRRSLTFRDVVEKTQLRVLTFDIENAPNTVHTWGLFKQNVAINQIVEPGRVFGFGGKWYDEPEPFFYGEGNRTNEEVIVASHEALNQADIVVSYNGIGFDSPHLNKEFLKLGLPPVKPVKHIDLLRVVRKQFNMTSNKLDFVAQFLGLGNKTEHSGFDLWKACMAGDPEAWELMETYCKQDVKLTEEVYNVLRPWIPGHPHLGVWLGEEWCCTNCGNAIDSRNLVESEAVAQVTAYNLYQCACGHWLRGTVVTSTKLKTRSARQ